MERHQSNVQHATRAVLFIDVVESVRLLEVDEQDMIARWRSLVSYVETDVLPAFCGRLVKSLGDGLLSDFEDPRAAVRAALAVQGASARANDGLAPERQMLLRMGIESAALLVDEHDVYGRGVMLGARLMTLAGPGEIVISENVRARLTPALDADVEDLGECYLKHMKEPVRAYRVGPPGPHPVVEPGLTGGELSPTVAVIPFAPRLIDPEHRMLGEVLADETIASLSRSPDLTVISRLSTTAFRGRPVRLDEIGAHLNADYVLSGAYHGDSQRIVLDVELGEAHSGRIVWAERIAVAVEGILSDEHHLIERLVAGVSAAVISRELQRARSQALPTLRSYTLLLAAIALMNRLSPAGFEQARDMLETLVARATRQAIPQAWLAKWHVLRVQQGWSDAPEDDARCALECTSRALEADACCALALTIDGFVHTNLLKRLDVAEERYDLAIECNPNEALAWLLKGTLHAFKGEGEAAVAGTRRALALSPLDPHRYFYESLAATAHLAARDPAGALALARSSLRSNRMHTSTLRAKAIAEWQLGLVEEARATCRELLAREPKLTIGRWLARTPSAGFEIGNEWAGVLREVGVPDR